MVMTASAARTNSSVRGLGNSRERSMPHSSMAATTAGLSLSPGADPAERTWTLPLAWWSRRAAAIWLRPALWTQTNRTSGTSLLMAPSAWARARSSRAGRGRAWAGLGAQRDVRGWAGQRRRRGPGGGRRFRSGPSGRLGRGWGPSGPGRRAAAGSRSSSGSDRSRPGGFAEDLEVVADQRLSRVQILGEVGDAHLL